MQWYEVTVKQTIEIEDGRNGKIKEKAVKEKLLVEADLVSEAEMRALKLYAGSDAEVVAVKESRIVDVVRDGEA